MITLDDLLSRQGQVTSIHIERWVARGLLRPSTSGGFETVDVARVSLLSELVGDIGFDDETAETVVAARPRATAARQTDFQMLCKLMLMGLGKND